ncbi:DMT family transporter [Limnovirga soli]|jgi:drug/metabolite transporter (DMT)-like permease|uniref:EamA family transporter n=1 Tax=Limnovirga soli TaxID=2656915 RepID=A0A8J8FMF3_9BACT|nr:DMT family transporter [Limnovirga soli]NNV57564.1 EamA family transporter [Limnovirga soli]
MSDAKQKNYLVGFIITFVGSVLFSTKAIIIKKAFADLAIPALSLLTLRMLFSTPFYVGAAFFNNNKKDNIALTRKEWILISVTGILGYYISSLLDFVGLQYVSAGMERLILFLYPTFVVLINAAWFKQKINRQQQLALLITYVGIGLAFFGELHFDNSTPNFLWGCFLIFLCAVTYSCYLVSSGQLIPKIGASKFTTYAMLTATAGIFTHFLITSSFSSIVWSKELLQYVILLAIAATVIPSFMLSYGIKKIGSNNSAVVTSIGPVSTIIQAHIFLGEPIVATQIIGTILVLTGIFVISWQKNTPGLPSE